MKTLTKTILALSGLLLLAGCGAAAQDPTPQVGPGYGPGWRHEQMVEARKSGGLPPHPMMMRGPGMHAYGPGAAAIGPDGKVDTGKLPPWCPYGTATPDAKTTK